MEASAAFMFGLIVGGILVTVLGRAINRDLVNQLRIGLRRASKEAKRRSEDPADYWKRPRKRKKRDEYEDGDGEDAGV